MAKSAKLLLNQTFIDKLPIMKAAMRFVLIGLLLVSAHTASLLGAPHGQVIAWGGNYWPLTNLPAGLNDVVTVSCGAANCFALKRNGTVVGWGRNFEDETAIPPGLSNVVAITSGGFFGNGYDYVIALKNDGTLVAWGSPELTLPTGLTGIVAIASSPKLLLTLTSEGRILCWGDSSLTNVPNNLSNVVAVAAGGSHSLALRSDGTVVSWGANSHGQTNVPPGLNSVRAIAAGSIHSLALMSNGLVVAWGNNSYGQTNVPTGLSNVIVVAASGNESGRHNLALKSNGEVVQWGQWAAITQTPPNSLSNVVALAVSPSASFAVVAPLRIESATYSNSNSVVRFHTFSGRNYSLEFSTNISSGGWDELPGTTIAGDGFIQTIIHSNSTLASPCYYRIREFE